MAVVTFEHIDGRRESIEAQAGQSLMEAAIYSGVEGIDADCGGELACATCHVVVAEEWRDKIAPPSSDERELLDLVVGKGPGSRLSCQIRIDAALDGLVVGVPASQH